MIPKTKSEQGRLGRTRGGTFERTTRHKLEDCGWIVCKWANIVKEGKMIAAPHKYNPFTKSVSLGHGFPDYVSIKKINGSRMVIGVESKMNKYLDAAEKEMCDWYLAHDVFDKIIISYKLKGHVAYKDYATGFESMEIDSLVIDNEQGQHNKLSGQTAKPKED